jgi:hypothetical protein
MCRHDIGTRNSRQRIRYLRRLPGWRGELLSEVSAAPDRQVAAGLIEGSRGAIDGLAPRARELLLARLADVILEIKEPA